MTQFAAKSINVIEFSPIFISEWHPLVKGHTHNLAYQLISTYIYLYPQLFCVSCFAAGLRVWTQHGTQPAVEIDVYSTLVNFRNAKG